MAAAIADLVHRNCAEDLACRHPFFSDLEKQTKLVSNNVQHASRACVMASFLLEPDGIVVGSMDLEYERLTQINWSKDCWLEPRCIVQPKSTAQVQRIMKIINRTTARFAIRSGGHNPNCGWASIGNEGVLIDLSLLSHVEISEDSLTVNIGPGNRWIDVYKKLDGSGRTVLGGRTPDVGVGGLLLGGGIPSFSSQFGFACDYVRRYEVVLSNGTVITADRKVNQDLWWALKGGGSNFGIVTQFELETVPIDRIWYESRIYEPRESLRLLEAVREYQVAAEADEKASFAFSLSNNHTIVAFIYSAPEAYPAVFNMFYDIPFRQNFIEPSFGTPYSLAAAFEQVLGDRPSFKELREVAPIVRRDALQIQLHDYVWHSTRYFKRNTEKYRSGREPDEFELEARKPAV
ncbi:hypothetical protein DL769_006901 [Monosporascus sp. CRB-8-3]|nr:hypothetical protein DL769_006901 [Monosporascus sp. CRB-8-3]